MGKVWDDKGQVHLSYRHADSSHDLTVSWRRVCVKLCVRAAVGPISCPITCPYPVCTLSITRGLQEGEFGMALWLVFIFGTLTVYIINQAFQDG